MTSKHRYLQEMAASNYNTNTLDVYYRFDPHVSISLGWYHKVNLKESIGRLYKWYVKK